MHQHKFFERKPGRDLTFYTRDGEITPYGNLDLSFDVFSKGIGNLLDGNGAGPLGNMGWMPDISTNLSYIGIRGFQSTGIKNLNFIYQLETQIDISSTSGSSETNSTQDNAVKGGLTSRNSFIGLGSASWGAVLFGKTDAPYKLSTTRMNPFVAMIGDYAAIMGNTGGDTRVEFGTRLDHSIWYTSKKLNGFEADVLFAPGQNRSNINNNIAAGEVDCTGNDNPGDGGDTPLGCNDGGFGNAVSASLTYTKEPLYIVVAYERHMKVNRQSDLTGLYANVPTAYFNADVADEDAGKIASSTPSPARLPSVPSTKICIATSPTSLSSRTSVNVKEAGLLLLSPSGSSTASPQAGLAPIVPSAIPANITPQTPCRRLASPVMQPADVAWITPRTCSPWPTVTASAKASPPTPLGPPPSTASTATSTSVLEAAALPQTAMTPATPPAASPPIRTAGLEAT
jgi:predicted porin